MPGRVLDKPEPDPRRIATRIAIPSAHAELSVLPAGGRAVCKALVVGWFGSKKRTPDEVQWECIQEEVRVAKQRRLAQTATKRDLVVAISAALFKADPVGINFETNADEYHAEAEIIVIALPKTSGPEDVRALTHEVFVHWFDPELAGPIERYEAVAEEIWSLWRHHQG